MASASHEVIDLSEEDKRTLDQLQAWMGLPLKPFRVESYPGFRCGAVSLRFRGRYYGWHAAWIGSVPVHSLMPLGDEREFPNVTLKEAIAGLAEAMEKEGANLVSVGASLSELMKDK